jgi:hypothetical protein
MQVPKQIVNTKNEHKNAAYGIQGVEALHRGGGGLWAEALARGRVRTEVLCRGRGTAQGFTPLSHRAGCGRSLLVTASMPLNHRAGV